MIVRVLTTTTLLLGATVAQALTPVSRLPAAQLAAPNVQAALDREARAQGPRPLLWAVPVERELPTLADGSWEQAGDRAVWRLPLSAVGARSLGLVLHSVQMPAAAQLSVSSLDGTQSRGPYAASDFHDGVLALPIIGGDGALISLSVPVGEQGAVDLQVARINYGFRSFKEATAKSGRCNVDIACPVGDDYRDEARAVARYTVDHPGAGTYLCTGTLMNNTALDGRPLFLTADHCFRNDDGQFVGDDDSIVLYWNDENTSCGGLLNDELTQSQSGTTVRATNAVSDFTLLELDAQPPAAYNVYYAGWDRRNLAPNGAASIHHPQGDAKAISIEYDATTITDYASSTAKPDADFIRIGDWDVGVTEGGSSGAALFNADHRVVGTLSGGFAACNALGTSDNNQPDWFGRLYAQWNPSSSSGASLKPWLDPAGSGASTLDGTDTFDDVTDERDSGGRMPPVLLAIAALGLLLRRVRRHCSPVQP